jgi:hypothetical protein
LVVVAVRFLQIKAPILWREDFVLVFEFAFALLYFLFMGMPRSWIMAFVLVPLDEEAAAAAVPPCCCGGGTGRRRRRRRRRRIQSA